MGAMPLRKRKSDSQSPKDGYSEAAKTAVQETTRRVQEMHDVIAGKSFDVLHRIPVISGPARLVQSAHDAISGGVYAAVHHGAGGLLKAAGMLERLVAESRPADPPGRRASALLAALNGAFGDHLANSNNRLAITMSLHANGAPLALTPDALRSALPDAGTRLCLLIHGLGCDERTWVCGKSAAASGIDFGRQLKADFAYTPVYLRYNTGVSIAENSVQLAGLLEELVQTWPHKPAEMVIIGHSMGGLIALGACEHAAESTLQWPFATRMVICLGSPYLGSPVERLGELATSVFNRFAITAPLGKIAATRSQGIKDLRRGPGAPRSQPAHAHIAFRFLGASLLEDSEHLLGEILGDGLVGPGSATTHEIEGDVQSARIGKASHMGLLIDARVYRQIRAWISSDPLS